MFGSRGLWDLQCQGVGGLRSGEVAVDKDGLTFLHIDFPYRKRWHLFEDEDGLTFPSSGISWFCPSRFRKEATKERVACGSVPQDSEKRRPKKEWLVAKLFGRD